MSIAFHEIEESIAAVLAQMDEADNPEEYAEALAATVEALGDAEEAKADAIAFTIAKMEAQAKAMQETITAIQSRKQSLLNNASRLKEYTYNVMKAHGINKIKGQSATLYFGKSKAVSVEDEAAIPRTYFVPQPDKLDKKALSAALKDGPVPGASLTESESLRILR